MKKEMVKDWFNKYKVWDDRSDGDISSHLLSLDIGDGKGFGVVMKYNGSNKYHVLNKDQCFDNLTDAKSCLEDIAIRNIRIWVNSIMDFNNLKTVCVGNHDVDIFYQDKGEFEK